MHNFSNVNRSDSELIANHSLEIVLEKTKPWILFFHQFNIALNVFFNYSSQVHLL